MITEFKDQYKFLSNYAPSSILYKGHRYRNAEAAFHAQKCLGREEEFENLEPNQAKSLGRIVPLRSDWEEVKLKEMESILKAKFRNPALRKKLLSTGNQELVEGNHWHDDYWGKCTPNGQNNLGKLLMKLRSEYQAKEEKKEQKKLRDIQKEKKEQDIKKERSAKSSMKE